MMVPVIFGLLESANSQGHGLRQTGMEIIAARPEAEMSYHSYKENIVNYVTKTISDVSESIMLIGHSFGGSMALEAAADLVKHGFNVRALILLDPVPHNFPWGFLGGNFKAPAGIPAIRCFWRNDKWYRPTFSHRLADMNLCEERKDLDHMAFCSDTKIRRFIINAALSV